MAGGGPWARAGTTRILAEEAGHSLDKIARTWKGHNLRVHMANTFTLSRDSHFVEKLLGVVNLYVDPSARAVGLAFDETSQIQVVDRT